MPNETFELPDDPIPTLGTNEIPVPQINPLYERQDSLGLTKPSVMIVGCGGVGCWIALALALGGVDDMTLWDGDTISMHNLNRFPLPPSSVGEDKSMALANWLNSLRPNSNIVGRGKFDPAIHPEAGAQWMICATDSLVSRRMCYAWHKKGMAAFYIEVGADGERWTLSPKPPEFSTDLEDNPGYQTVPVHVGPCMMAGAAVAYYVLHDTMPTVSHLVDWDKGPLYSIGTTRNMYNRTEISFASLNFETMDEVAKPDVQLVLCSNCHREIEMDDITFIRHIVECRGLSLVEARRLQVEIFSAVNQAESPVTLGSHVTDIRTWDVGEIEIREMAPEREDNQ